MLAGVALEKSACGKAKCGRKHESGDRESG
jgi:hypothetical protein